MANKAKHAFGSSDGLKAALAAGTINARDILFLDENTPNPKLGWIDKQGNPVIVNSEKIIKTDALPEVGEDGKIYIFNNEGYFWSGDSFVSLSKATDVTELEAKLAEKASVEEVTARVEESIASANSYTDEKIKAASNEHLIKKYEIVSVPEGTLVDYSDKEIRIMCPENTHWVKQNVGPTGNANMYYMGFKAYAPETAVSFKEGDRGEIIDEMFTFDDDFAGTDEFGRNYSICWLALASYDEATDTWTYYGKNSSVEKYIGWTYVVEWYNSNGIVIATDSVRINLSNEGCHYAVEPYYMAEIKKEIDAKIAEVSVNEIIEF